MRNGLTTSVISESPGYANRPDVGRVRLANRADAQEGKLRQVSLRVSAQGDSRWPVRDLISQITPLDLPVFKTSSWQ